MRRAARTRRASRMGVHGPAERAPAAEIEHRDQIQPALAGQDAGSVAGPNLIDPANAQVLHSIGCDRATVAAVGSVRAILGTLPGVEPFQAHEPSDAVAFSRTTQGMSDSRAAVSLTTAGELFSDPLA
jgi:hypothetical protein